MILQFLQNKYMPNKDKTGPRGEGPMTGRGIGKCNDKVEKESLDRNYGNRRGSGQGLRQGNRRSSR